MSDHRPSNNDHFSDFAATYAAFRPTYPDKLFAWLSAQAPSRTHAWDCATGNGQAAVSLARHFDTVTATDVSAPMIAAAQGHPRITYSVAAAEVVEFPPQSLDLITVAQALHWFDLPAFWRVCAQALKPGGVLAVWGYLLPATSPGVDALVHDYHDVTVGPYWPPDRQPLLQGYARITPPAVPLAVPSFTMTAQWTVDHLIGLLDSWSATHRARQALSLDPLAPLIPALRTAWGDIESLAVTWPLVLRAFRFSGWDPAESTRV